MLYSVLNMRQPLVLISGESLCSTAAIDDALKNEGLISEADFGMLQQMSPDYGRVRLGQPEEITSPRLSLLAGALAGQQLVEVEQATRKIFRDPEFPWHRYLKNALDTFHEEGFRIELLTSLPKCLADNMIERDSNCVSGSLLAVDDKGEFTGEISLVFGPLRKGIKTQQYLTGVNPPIRLKHGFTPPAEVVAIGHSQEDEPMLRFVSTFQHAGHIATVVCFDPTPGIKPFIQPNWITPDPSEPLSAVYTPSKSRAS